MLKMKVAIVFRKKGVLLRASLEPKVLSTLCSISFPGSLFIQGLKGERPGEEVGHCWDHR